MSGGGRSSRCRGGGNSPARGTGNIPFKRGGQHVEDQVDPFLVSIIVGFVHRFVVKPPQLSRLHADLFLAGLEPGAEGGFQDEVVAVADLVVFAPVSMWINLSAGGEAHDFCPPEKGAFFSGNKREEFPEEREAGGAAGPPGFVDIPAGAMALRGFDQSSERDRERFALHGSGLLAACQFVPNAVHGRDLREVGRRINALLEFAKILHARSPAFHRKRSPAPDYSHKHSAFSGTREKSAVLGIKPLWKALSGHKACPSKRRQQHFREAKRMMLSLIPHIALAVQSPYAVPFWRVALRGRILLSAFFLAAMTGGTAQGALNEDFRRGTVALDRAGSFDFTFRAWQGRPFKVWIHVPETATAESRVLFVMHGVERDARRYLAEWKKIADRERIILVAPEFSERQFPGSAEYNLGGVTDPKTGTERARDTWLFSAIEPLFDDVKRRTGSQAPGYSIYGHSAGGQFVHRFVMLGVSQRLDQAIAANSGWYTWPDERASYPAGLRLGGRAAVSPGDAFDRRLTVLLGTADTESDGPNLREDRWTREQGENRLERGRAFFADAQKLARKGGHRLRWALRYVPGAGHDNRQMVPAAAALLETSARTVQNPAVFISVPWAGDSAACSPRAGDDILPRRWRAPECLPFGDYLVSAIAPNRPQLQAKGGHVWVRTDLDVCEAPKGGTGQISVAILDAKGRDVSDSRRLRTALDTFSADGADVVLAVDSPRAGRVTYSGGMVVVHLAGKETFQRVKSGGKSFDGETIFVSLSEGSGRRDIRLALYPVLLHAKSGTFRHTSSDPAHWKPFAQAAQRITSRSRDGLKWTAGRDEFGDFLTTTLTLRRCTAA